LTGDNGTIDLDRLALHPPEQILPCRPTTFADYRRLLLDRIPELENVWLTPSADHNRNGLYRIEFRCSPENGRHEQQITAKLRSLYGRTRNLCEDLDRIRMIGEDPCELNGRIEITDKGSPSEILAEIYHACAVHIVGESGQQQGTSPHPPQALDQLFDGPRSESGRGGDLPADGGTGEILLTDLLTLIKDVDGVANVKELWLSKGGRDFFDAMPQRSPEGLLRLQIPEEPGAVQLTLETVAGREIPLHFPTFRTRYADRAYRHQAARRSASEFASTYPRPNGKRRDFQAYSSVQHLLPPAYGVNAYGVPESAPDEVKGRAAQMKGYLLLFDQLMADYTANLDHICDLFAIRSPDGQSYHCQLVRNEGYPPLSTVYPDDAQQQLADLVNRYDGFIERKNRVLDYLLALHGETFPQAMLRNFTLYAIDPLEHETALLEAKAAYLRAVVEVGRDRGGALDYTIPCDQWRGEGGFQHRISLLLGFREDRGFSLTGPFSLLGLALEPFPEVNLETGAPRSPTTVTEAAEKLPLFSIPLVPAAETDDPAMLLAAARQAMPLLADSIPEPLLRGGTKLDNWNLETAGEQGQFLCLVDAEANQRRPLCSCDDVEEAIELANSLRRLCLHLNRMSEGVHVVEHILLRPGAVPAHPDVPEDFYAFRLSLLFPAWTVRCHDRKFRALAEDIVRMNTPAHLYAEVFWLDFPQMSHFEQLFTAWLEAKCTATGPDETVDERACQLIQFFQTCRTSHD
ncbi:MAG: hypothetical protein AB7E77_11385, partial [Desulfobulbus sp.]